jgi:radical SAM protein with 4Fe4S-binding SPASM domain
MKKGAKPTEMTAEQINAIMDEIAPYKPSLTLNVANEPLLAKHFADCVISAKKHGLACTFNTNGTALTEKIARFLVDIEFDSISFSIDAMTSETLKKVRGLDSIEKVNAKVELMLKVRGEKAFPRIAVSFVDQEANAHEFSAFLEYWKKKVDFIRWEGRIDSRGKRTAVLSTGDTSNRIPCHQLFKQFVLRSDGRASPCVIMAADASLSAGNIFTDGGVKAVWNGEILSDMRRMHNEGDWDKIPACKECEYWTDSRELQEEERDGFLIRYSSPYAVFYNVLDRLGNWNRDLTDRIGSSLAE